MNDIHDIIFNDEIGEMNKTDKEIEKRLRIINQLYYTVKNVLKNLNMTYGLDKLYKKIKEKYYDINDNNDFSLEDSRYQVIEQWMCNNKKR